MAAILFSLAPVSGFAQTPLTNGLSQSGSVSVVGGSNVWSIAVSGGDRVTVQVAKLTGGAGFTPRIELFGPDGESLGARANATAARLDIQPAASGTYTLVVKDLTGTGTGTYSVQLAQTPESFLIPAGDEGGPLTNGLIHTGAITLGDLDMWTFSATNGDRFSVQVAKVTGGAGFTPMIEVFSPDGVRVGANLGNVSARLDFQAIESGNYTVLISDANQTGSGTYQLELAEVPETFLVPPGHNGGALTDGVDMPGTVAIGDLNQWSFAASPGDHITLTATKVTGGAGFTPKLEIIDPTGAVKGTAVNATAATLDIAISVAGNYRVIVSDATQIGLGTYQLHLTRGVIAAGTGALINGTTYLDSIGSVHQTNTYTLTASIGESIVVRMGETASSTLAPALQLYDPDGLLVVSSLDSASTEVTARAAKSGTFKVIAFDGSSHNDQTGNYRISMAKTGDALSISGSDEGGAMTNGSTYLAAISTGDIDAWTLSANVGDAIVVRAGETTAGSTLAPWLRIYGPNGALLSSALDAGATEVTTRATNSGTFLVVVGDGNTHLDGVGNYRISFAKTGSPVSISPTDEGGALVNGFTTLATIDTGDIDAWTVNANAGETILVRAGELSSSTSLAPQLRLYGPDGVLLSSDLDLSAAEVTARATNSGTFLVVVSDGNTHEDGTGNYRINLVKTGSPITISPSDDGGPIVNGSSYLGTIDLGNMDVWTLSAKAGDTIVARMGDISGGTLNPEVRLYGPNGALLSSSLDTLAAEATARATNSGVFLVVVSDGNTHLDGIGNYSLTMIKTGDPLVISPSDEGGALVNGSSYLAAIDIGDLDGWTISANAGDTIIVRAGETLAGSTLAPWLRIYSPDGVLLSSQLDAASTEVTTRATTNGTYLVIAGDGNTHLNGTSNYRISLAKTGDPLTISPGDEGGPLINGSTYLATIDTGDIDAWTVDAKAGQAIVVRAGELTAGTLAPWVRLYGPDGASLSSALDATVAEVSFKTTNSGTFMVVVGDGNTHLDGSGNYRISLAKTGEPLSITPGDEGGAMTGGSSYDGTIDLGDNDAWTFNAFAGDLISISVAEAVSGSTLTPWLRLYGRDGTLLQNVSSLTVAQFTNYPAPANGTYLVVVGDGNTHLDGSGNYLMAVKNLLGQVHLRQMNFSGTNLNVLGVGGNGATSYTLLTSTNAATPLASWSTVPGQFDQYGVFTYTNLYNPAESQRFFYLKTP